MSAVLPDDLDGANCANIVVIRPGNQIVAEYIAFLVNSQLGQRQLVGASVGSAQGVVNTTAVKAWHVPYPPINIQMRFSALVKEVRSASEKSGVAESTGDDLFHSLVQRAFRGEL